MWGITGEKQEAQCSYCCVKYNAVQRAAPWSAEVLFNKRTNYSQILKSKGRKSQEICVRVISSIF